MTHTFKHGLRVTDERDMQCGLTVSQPWHNIGVSVHIGENKLFLYVRSHYPQDIPAFIQAITEADEAITEANQHLNQ